MAASTAQKASGMNMAPTVDNIPANRHLTLTRQHLLC